MNFNNYADWDNNDSNVNSNNNLYEEQFKLDQKIQNNQFSRDEINDKLLERGHIPSLARHINHANDSILDNADNKFYGRLDSQSSSRKPETTKNNETNKNQIWEHYS